jgi:hypothetical protein
MLSAMSALSPSWLPVSSCFLDKQGTDNKENQLDCAAAVSSDDEELTSRTDEDINGFCRDEPNEAATTTTTTTGKGSRQKRTREDPACLSVSQQYRIRKLPVNASQERALKQHKTRRPPKYQVIPLAVACPIDLDGTTNVNAPNAK